MPVHIRHKAVDESTRRKIKQAAPIVTMYKWEADVDEWQGEDCDLLVAGTVDDDGRAAMTHAADQGIPVVTIGTDAPDTGGFNLAPESSIADTARVLKSALEAPA